MRTRQPYEISVFLTLFAVVALLILALVLWLLSGDADYLWS